MVNDHGAGADRRQREVLLEIWSRRWSYSKLASIWRRADQDQGAHCATGAQIRVASINLGKVHQSNPGQAKPANASRLLPDHIEDQYLEYLQRIECTETLVDRDL